MATLKDLKRMCESYPECNGCPLYIREVQRCRPCDFYLSGNIDEVIDKWALEHPIKTYMQDFFEKFPNAPKNEYRTPKMCPHQIYPEIDANYRCCENCLKCWSQEMKEE